jgi:hypothetical protein
VILRRGLGADVQRIYEQIDGLLGSKDAIIILADGHHAIHYARGFRLSACHHELLAVQVERAIRGVTGANQSKSANPSLSARSLFRRLKEELCFTPERQSNLEAAAAPFCHPS